MAEDEIPRLVAREKAPAGKAPVSKRKHSDASSDDASSDNGDSRSYSSVIQEDPVQEPNENVQAPSSTETLHHGFPAMTPRIRRLA